MPEMSSSSDWLRPAAIRASRSRCPKCLPSLSRMWLPPLVRAFAHPSTRVAANGTGASGTDAPGAFDVGLLDLDGCAGRLELLLGLVGGFPVDLLEDGLGSAVHQVLGLLQAQARERAHLLDNLDLLVARAGEDHVELRLLLLSAGLAAGGGTRGSPGHHHRSRRRGL